MKILDRYLIKQFFLFLAGGVFLFVFIFIIVDMSDNLTSYLESGKSGASIFLMYLYQTPSLIMLLYPIGALIALYFSVGMMVKENELTAIKSAGISVYRFLMPMFVFMLLLSSILFLFNEYAVTGATKRYREIKDHEVFTPGTARDFHIFQRDGVMVSGDMFTKKSLTVMNPKIYVFSENKEISDIYAAEKAYYQNSFWYFSNGQHISFRNGAMESEPLRDKLVEVMSLTPDEILTDMTHTDIYTISELSSRIKFMKKSGYDFRRQTGEIYYRLFYIFITLIILVIGSSFVIDIKNRGIIFGLALSILISFIYWGTLQSFRSMGENGYISMAAAFIIPNGAFMALGALLLYKARK